MNHLLSLSVQLTEKDLRHVVFYNSYRHPLLLMLLFWFLLILGGAIADLLGFQELEWSSSQISMMVLAVLGVFVLPVFFIWNVRKSFRQNPSFAAPSHYHFSQENIDIQGATFTVSLTWDQIKKVKETSSWFLLYLNGFTAHILPKNQLSHEEISSFRKFLATVPNLKTKLKSS